MLSCYGMQGGIDKLADAPGLAYGLLKVLQKYALSNRCCLGFCNKFEHFSILFVSNFSETNCVKEIFARIVSGEATGN